MSNELVTAIVSIVLAIIGLAALATLIAPQAATSKVIGAASQGLATDITAAVSPVTGGGIGSFNLGGFSGGFGNGLA